MENESSNDMTMHSKRGGWTQRVRARQIYIYISYDLIDVNLRLIYVFVHFISTCQGHTV